MLTGDIFVATEAVENLFDKQRQEQEQVLRAVAAGKRSWGFVSDGGGIPYDLSLFCSARSLGRYKGREAQVYRSYERSYGYQHPK